MSTFSISPSESLFDKWTALANPCTAYELSTPPSQSPNRDQPQTPYLPRELINNTTSISHIGSGWEKWDFSIIKNCRSRADNKDLQSIINTTSVL